MKKYLLTGGGLFVLLLAAIFALTPKQATQAQGRGLDELLKSEGTVETLVCDSYGKTWDITLTPCSEAAPGRCVSGFRDVDNSLSCEPLPLDGTFVNGVLSVTAYDNPDNTCISTHWTGNLSLRAGAITGAVSNEFGPFGEFALISGACSTTLSLDGADPALK